MPGWISDLLIIVGLIVVAVGILGGDKQYDFFYGVEYVMFNVKRTTMLWVGGLTVGVGFLLRMTTESRPRKRRRQQEY